MELIDTIIQLQRSGMTDEQIISTLQSQGYSPKDVSESINQAQIKNAFNQTGQGETGEVQIPSPDYQQGYPQQQYQQDYSQPDQGNYSDNYLITIKMSLQENINKIITNNQVTTQKL